MRSNISIVLKLKKRARGECGGVLYVDYIDILVFCAMYRFPHKYDLEIQQYQKQKKIKRETYSPRCDTK